MPLSSLKSKGTVLITGGAKRIGRAIALHLAPLGYSIAIHYHHSRKPAEDLAKDIRTADIRCEIFKADLSNSKQVASLITAVLKRLPDLNCLVNSASIFERSTLKEGDLKDFDLELAVNLRAPFILSSQFARYIREGNIINILDTNVSKAKTAHFAYLIAKKSLLSMTCLAASELAPGIRVNAVAPGLILPPEKKGADYLERLAKNIPLKRKGEPADIARAVQFLIENNYITGQTIFVDGGEHLK